MTLEEKQLQDRLDTLLSNNFAGSMSAFGADDEFVEFTGRAKSFTSERLTDRRFGVRITSGDTDLILAIATGSFETDRVPLVFTYDGTTAKSLSGSTVTTTGFVFISHSGSTTTLSAGRWVEVYGGTNVFIKSLDNVGTTRDNPTLVNKVIACDAILDDGIENLVYHNGSSGYLKITPLDRTKPVSLFKNFINANASRVVGMLMNVNNSNYNITQQVVTLQQISPFKNYADDKIWIQDNMDKNQNIKEKIEIACDFQFDDKQVVLLTIPAGSDFDLTFLIGSTASTATALRKKAEKAQKKMDDLGIKPAEKATLTEAKK